MGVLLSAECGFGKNCLSAKFLETIVSRDRKMPIVGLSAILLSCPRHRPPPGRNLESDARAGRWEPCHSSSAVVNCWFPQLESTASPLVIARLPAVLGAMPILRRRHQGSRPLSPTCSAMCSRQNDPLRRPWILNLSTTDLLVFWTTTPFATSRFSSRLRSHDRRRIHSLIPTVASWMKHAV